MGTDILNCLVMDEISSFKRQREHCFRLLSPRTKNIRARLETSMIIDSNRIGNENGNFFYKFAMISCDSYF